MLLGWHSSCLRGIVPGAKVGGEGSVSMRRWIVLLDWK